MKRFSQLIGATILSFAVAASANFPKPPGLFTIKDVGGWSEVNKKFFDKEGGIVAGIERQVGVSVGS